MLFYFLWVCMSEYGNYRKLIKCDLEDTIEFFSNKKKSEREIWVLKEFLSYFPPIDLPIKPSKDEPYDVFCGDYGFQIKEICPDGRKRDDEYKEMVKSFPKSTPSTSYSHEHIPLEQSLPRVIEDIEKYRTTKYFDLTSKIDVLVYLNLPNTTYTSDSPLLDFEELKYWRSVSLVSNNCALVLSCQNKTNKILFPWCGQLKIKENWDKHH